VRPFAARVSAIDSTPHIHLIGYAVINDLLKHEIEIIKAVK
jgi:hypothetical protein